MSELLTQGAFWENSLWKFLPSPSHLARSAKLLDLIILKFEQSFSWNWCHLKGHIMRFNWSTHTFLSVERFGIYKPAKCSSRVKSWFKQTSECSKHVSAMELSHSQILWFLLYKTNILILKIDKKAFDGWKYIKKSQF